MNFELTKHNSQKTESMTRKGENKRKSSENAGVLKPSSKRRKTSDGERKESNLPQLPSEIWSLIINLNYERFCVEISYELKLKKLELRTNVIVFKYSDFDMGKIIFDNESINDFIVEIVFGHMLRNRSLILKTANYSGLTLLTCACQYQPSVAELLIKNGANVNSGANVNVANGNVAARNRTPLINACQYQPSVVELLIKNGANVNAATPYIPPCYGNEGGITPLINACQYQPSVVEMLIRNGANVNTSTDNGFTPLICACLNANEPSVVEILIRNGANVNASTNYGITPLICACEYQSSLVRCLI